MRAIWYHKPYMAGLGAGNALSGIVLLVITDMAWFGILCGVGLLVVAARCFLRMADTTPLLAFDAAGLTLRTVWRNRSLAWSDVRGIGTTVYRPLLRGFLSTGRIEFLTVTVKGGLFGARRIRVASGMLGPDHADLHGLIAQMQIARAFATRCATAPQAAPGAMTSGLSHP